MTTPHTTLSGWPHRGWFFLEPTVPKEIEGVWFSICGFKVLPVPGPAALVRGWAMYLPAYQLLRQRGR